MKLLSMSLTSALLLLGMHWLFPVELTSIYQWMDLKIGPTWYYLVGMGCYGLGAVAWGLDFPAKSWQRVVLFRHSEEFAGPTVFKIAILATYIAFIEFLYERETISNALFSTAIGLVIPILIAALIHLPCFDPLVREGGSGESIEGATGTLMIFASAIYALGLLAALLTWESVIKSAA